MPTLYPFSLRAALALLAVLALPLAASAQTAAPEPAPKQLSAAVSEHLPSLRTLTEAKRFTEALRIIDNLLPAAAPGSYDAHVLTQIKIQVLLTLSRYAETAAVLEAVVNSSAGPGFLEPDALRQHLYLLSQVYYQQAGEAKDAAARLPLYERATATLQRWFDLTAQPTADARLYAADLLYNAAITDPAHLDRDKLARARAEAERSLRLQIKANPRAYILILAVSQQLGEREASAETLELLVALQPQNEAYWQQLGATYLNLAAAAKDPAEAQRHTLRALITIERAQALGLLRTSREALNRVALYFNLQRYDRATALLETGLADGSIENSRRNWEFLASAYQQSHQLPQALASLEKAVAAFPQDGQLEFTLAQLLYGQGRSADALARLETAVAKGGLEKPGQARLFLGYVAFELRRYADAVRWTDEATSFADVKADDLKRLNQAARVALNERAARTPAKL